MFVGCVGSRVGMAINEDDLFAFADKFLDDFGKAIVIIKNITDSLPLKHRIVFDKIALSISKPVKYRLIYWICRLKFIKLTYK
jgi:hypothetical protein